MEEKSEKPTEGVQIAEQKTDKQELQQETGVGAKGRKTRKEVNQMAVVLE